MAIFIIYGIIIFVIIASIRGYLRHLREQQDKYKK